MFGALIGDCVGSFWGFSGNKDKTIPLWVPACCFTDDSVCTAATAAWLVHDDAKDFTQVLHQRGRSNSSSGFGAKMMSWLLSNNPTPYGSWGNGSAMRVSPVALWANNETELLDLAARSAMPTHNSEQAIRGAQATAWAIRYALEMPSSARETVLGEVERRFGYVGLSTRDPEAERPTHRFDVSCEGTVPLALAIAVRSGSFDDMLRWCCSMGGDADTLGAIAGPGGSVVWNPPSTPG
jgi:ADP-ribosyl-[dinitrogen reductase] hydrolase